MISFPEKGGTANNFYARSRLLLFVQCCLLFFFNFTFVRFFCMDFLAERAKKKIIEIVCFFRSRVRAAQLLCSVTLIAHAQLFLLFIFWFLLLHSNECDGMPAPSPPGYHSTHTLHEGLKLAAARTCCCRLHFASLYFFPAVALCLIAFAVCVSVFRNCAPISHVAVNSRYCSPASNCCRRAILIRRRFIVSKRTHSVLVDFVSSSFFRHSSQHQMRIVQSLKHWASEYLPAFLLSWRHGLDTP